MKNLKFSLYLYIDKYLVYREIHFMSNKKYSELYEILKYAIIYPRIIDTVPFQMKFNNKEYTILFSLICLEVFMIQIGFSSNL